MPNDFVPKKMRTSLKVLSLVLLLAVFATACFAATQEEVEEAAAYLQEALLSDSEEQVAADSAEFTEAGGITLYKLRQIMPNLAESRAKKLLTPLNKAMSWGKITTCKRMAAFLAQIAHESAELRYMEEIASGAAYEGRRDLGNVRPGDGRRYKGRGPIQLTGRNNYRAAGKALGINLEARPQLASSNPEIGFKVSIWFWKSHGLNGLADKNSSDSFKRITRIINGGYNGLADRQKYWSRARRVLKC